MKFKNLDQLKTYAENMEQTEAWNVGPSCSNHQRAVYRIGRVQILIDTVLPYNWFKPSREWYWTGENMSEAEAQKYAPKYNARIEDAYYSDIDEKQLIFDELDDLLRWVFDTKKSELELEFEK